ncbi:transferase, partial [Arthrobacter crystallopoietes BAB-32]
MRITYFLTTADQAGGTERAIITQANSMVSDGHQVSLLSLYRETGKTFFELDPRIDVEYLIERDSWKVLLDGETDSTDHSLLGSVSSRLIPEKWDNQHNALTDVVLS